MLMIDKASGELGKTIAHPLQSKVDRILYLNLGDREGWELGATIRFDRFDHIRNKIYVRQRLEQLGFTLCPNSTDYKLTGIKGYSKLKARAPRVKSKLELASIALGEGDINTANIRKMLSKGLVISSSKITKQARRKLIWIISSLKTVEGVSITPERVRGFGEDFMIYALTEVYINIMGDVQKISRDDVAAYLEKHGEMTAAKVGVSPGKIGRWVYELRLKGWQIETIGIGQRRVVTYKLISRP